MCCRNAEVIERMNKMKNKSKNCKKKLLTIIKSECNEGKKVPLTYTDGYYIDYVPKAESRLRVEVESFIVFFSNKQNRSPIEIVCNALWIGRGKNALHRVEDIENKWSCK